MLNAAVRYHPIVRFIKKKKPETICEIGSGSNGLGEFLNVKFVGCDIEFLARINKNMVPVKADARRLPFPANSFDLVFSLDTIEHIPAKDRKKVLEEMFRISKKYVILGFPCDDVARDIDAEVNKFYDILGLKKPAWIDEHLTNVYPTSKDMYALLKKFKCSYKVMANGNLLFHKLVILVESLPLIFLITNIFGKLFIRLPETMINLFNRGQAYRKIFYIEKAS